MSVVKYLYEEGCERATFQDHCNFEVIDIRVAKVGTSQQEGYYCV